jgi:hypothetical protein
MPQKPLFSCDYPHFPQRPRQDSNNDENPQISGGVLDQSAQNVAHPDPVAGFLDEILTAIPSENQADFFRSLADQLDGAKIPE